MLMKLIARSRSIPRCNTNSLRLSRRFLGGSLPPETPIGDDNVINDNYDYKARFQTLKDLFVNEHDQKTLIKMLPKSPPVALLVLYSTVHAFTGSLFEFISCSTLFISMFCFNDRVTASTYQKVWIFNARVLGRISASS